MNRLELARIEINRVDKEIAKLFEERMKAVEEVINFKIENNLDILDSSRENEVIERNKKLIEEKKYEKYYVDLITNMMRISKNYQKEIVDKYSKGE
ncbi:chorismate mutase [Fusobacterium sp.]|uniref:chorismate mutase n=1 Tax=Fusobacterium sp. TaxID=68766 RepID=UPI0025BE9708|nr:chorismate mutase [Fusobacterium sp.]